MDGPRSPLPSLAEFAAGRPESCSPTDRGTVQASGRSGMTRQAPHDQWDRHPAPDASAAETLLLLIGKIGVAMIAAGQAVTLIGPSLQRIATAYWLTHVKAVTQATGLFIRILDPEATMLELNTAVKWIGVLLLGVGAYCHLSAPRGSLPWLWLVLLVVWIGHEIGRPSPWRLL